MDLTKLTVILLHLAASTCWGELVIKDTTKYEKSVNRLDDVVVNIMTSCYKGKITGVALGGNLPSTLYRRLSIEHSIPIVLIGSSRGVSLKKTIVPVRFRKILNIFIFEASSRQERFDFVQVSTRYSIWFTSQCAMLLIDLTPGCQNLQNFLFDSWAIEMLNTKVLCRDHKSGRIIFSFNPYTSRVPVSWKWEFEFSRRPITTNTMTVLSWARSENEKLMCEHLNFDITADIGGYAIDVKGPREDYSKKTVKTHGRGTYAFETRRRSILATLFRHLNATVRFAGHLQRIPAIHSIPDGLQYTQITHSYPHRQVEANIITQFRGHKSQLTKILSIIDVDSQYGMGVVYLITLIFLKIVVRQALGPALLNLIRMTCNTGIENVPNNTGPRIYLGCLLFFVVTMQGIFQGDLAARLTKCMPLRNVESVQDLEDLGYSEIYGNQYYRRVFEGLKIQKNFIVNSNESDCIMRVVNNPSAAYIGRTEGFIIDMVEKFNLHISKKPVEMIYVGFPVFGGWGLIERVNKMISRLVEANALELWEIKCKPIELSDFYVDPMVKTNVDFKNLELHELRFAFVILGIGLSCATVVFVIEQMIGYKYVCDITICRHGDTWEERVVEVLPDNRRTQ